MNSLSGYKFAIHSILNFFKEQMDLSKSIDIYCERLDNGLWAEPINAATNAAFILTAIIMWLRCKNLADSGGVAESVKRSDEEISAKIAEKIASAPPIGTGVMVLFV